ARMPLLGAVLGLSLPDNEFTRAFDAKLRKVSLESLLVDCMRAQARAAPLLLVLEDCHWLDPLSHDLLETIGRAIADLPVLLVLTSRPTHTQAPPAPLLSQLRYFTEIRMVDFQPQEAEQLISLKLVQLYDLYTEVSPELVKQITARAEG